MKISGFTIVQNAVKYHYPALESIRSILPLCDEFIVNVGESEDATLALIGSLKSPKIKVMKSQWDFSKGKEVLSFETNRALKQCQGDWAFYLQSDEVIHEADHGRLLSLMKRYLNDKDVEALRFQWLHFYGSYFRYRIDKGWFQKQDRIIRNNGQIRSCGDAYGFERIDGKEIKRKQTYCLLYHYGWVHTPEVMAERRQNAEQIGFATLTANEKEGRYQYGDLERFPAYFGTHPGVMQKRIEEHDLSQDDWKKISEKYWWHPAKIARLRYKTPFRVKEKIG